VQGNGLFSCARRRGQVLAKYRSSCNNPAVKALPAFEVVSFAARRWFPALGAKGAKGASPSRLAPLAKNFKNFKNFNGSRLSLLSAWYG